MSFERSESAGGTENEGPEDSVKKLAPLILIILLSTRQADRKVRTHEELEAVMKEPKRAPSREIWMHESLVDEARRLWEQMVVDLERS